MEGEVQRDWFHESDFQVPVLMARWIRMLARQPHGFCVTMGPRPGGWGQGLGAPAGGVSAGHTQPYIN